MRMLSFRERKFMLQTFYTITIFPIYFYFIHHSVYLKIITTAKVLIHNEKGE